MSETLANLRSIPTDQLIKTHDFLAQNTIAGVQYYLDELARRDTENANKTLLELTSQMKWMTVTIVVLTVVNVILVAFSVWGAH